MENIWSKYQVLRIIILKRLAKMSLANFAVLQQVNEAPKVQTLSASYNHFSGYQVQYSCALKSVVVKEVFVREAKHTRDTHRYSFNVKLQFKHLTNFSALSKTTAYCKKL